MFKKQISMIVVITMLLSVFAPAFSAFASEDYSDYVAGEKPADLLPDTWIYGNTNDANVSFGWSVSGVYGTDTLYEAKKDIFYTATTKDWSAGGTLIKGSNVNGGNPLAPNTTYIFSAQFRNAGAAGTNPKFGVYYSGNKSRVFSNEYGAGGWPLQSEFKDYTVTFSTGENTSGTFVLGLVEAKAGDKVHMNYKNGMYLAPETAYDITNVITGENVIYAGESTTIKTEVLNQLYTKGNINQSVSYRVLDAQRTHEVEGFTVTPVADGIARVDVSDEVLTGDYVILAVSDTYPGFRKGAVLKVLGRGTFQDYVPGEKPANIIVNSSKAGCFTPSNSSIVEMSNNDDSFIYTEKALKKEDWWGVVPTMFSPANNNISASLLASKDYVFSVDVKNLTPDTRPDMKLALGSGTEKYFEIPVPNSEFENKTVTFSPTTDTLTLTFGFDAKIDRSEYTNLGSIAIAFAPNPLYIAEEVAYDIDVSALDEVPLLKGGDSITLGAKVLNQVGTTGNLAQEFDWYALNADKTKIISDINITSQDNGKTAIVTLAEDIESGTYSIVAKSRNYEDFVKTFSISTGVVSEYIPGEKPLNMVKTPANVNTLLQNNGAGGVVIQGDWKEKEYFRWQETARETNAYWRVGPTIITTNPDDAPGLDRSFVKGQNYVISVRLKNDTPDKGAIMVGVANHWDHVLTIPVESSEYQTYTGTFTASLDTGCLCFGFDAREASSGGKILNMDISDGGSLYVAEEVGYDVLVEANNTIFVKGEVLEASATFVNQLGNKGKLAQEFEWTVLDKNKTKYDGYFVLDVSEDTTSVALSANTAVPCGTYYLAVNPKSDASMVKLIEFKLKKEGITYYVSTQGDDDADGTISSPLRTLAAAKAKVAAIKDKNSYEFINVVLRGGEYRVSKTLNFTEADSGTDETPITYKAYEGEKPVIKGSVVLDTSKMREALSVDIVPRLHPDAQGKVMVIDLDEQGLTDSDIFDMTQEIATFYSLSKSSEPNSLFADGVEQTLSQWPNDRNYAIRGNSIVDETYTDADGKEVKISNKFIYTQSEPDRWFAAKGWYIGAYIPYDYSYARLSVDKIDTVNKTIKIHSNSNNKKDFSFTDNFSKRWKAFNLIEEIDVPGEYAIDSQNKKIYYYPPCDMENSILEIGTMSEPFVSVVGAQNIGFEGITFTQTNSGAFSMKDVYNVDVRKCNFSAIGATAISVSGSMKAQTNKDYWQRQDIDGSYNCDIAECVFTNLANSAITMSGGNVDTLEKSNNTIENNFIYDFSQNTLSSSNGAIAIGGCGITVRNNNISLSPGIAILINGNDHIIEYNEIYDVMREVQDAGAIYQGRNALARGSAIRYNYLHDMRALDNLTNSSQVGIYLDDAQQGLTIVNNIIKNVKVDFNSNGAAAYDFSGNTTIDVDRAWNLLNHGSTRTSTVTTGPSGTLEFIESQIYDKQLYFEHYPDLEKFLDVDRQPGNNPKYFTVAKDNLAVNVGATNIQSENQEFSTLENNQSISDESYSIFVDADNQDYRIKDSTQYALSSRLTESFDIEKIGMQGNFALDSAFVGFDTVYPKNGDVLTNSGEEVNLIWNAANGATGYTVTVATDEKFENIVYEEDTRLTSAKVKGLEYGTNYYWTVEAKNTSREFADSWICKNPASRFTLVNPETAVTLSDVTMDKYDSLYVFSANVKNGEQNPVSDFDIIYAAYSGGRLVVAGRDEKTIPAGQSLVVESSFATEGKYTIEEIKIFVWGRTSLVPYAKVRVLK